MNTRVVFILDSDVFMEAARRYYAFDIVPSFWLTIIRQAELGNILSIDRVKSEIDRGNDMLKEWANNEFRSWFQTTDNEEVLIAYAQLMNWANQQTQYTNAAKADFSRAENADAWIIAYSIVNACTIVTHEQINLECHIKIPIPNVCQAYNIHHVDTFQMLRHLNINLG